MLLSALLLITRQQVCQVHLVGGQVCILGLPYHLTPVCQALQLHSQAVPIVTFCVHTQAAHSCLYVLLILHLQADHMRWCHTLPDHQPHCLWGAGLVWTQVCDTFPKQQHLWN